VLKMKEDNIEEKVSKEELRSLVEVGREHGIINEVEKEMIENIIEFDEKVAREIMIPRTKVFLIDKNISVDELFEKKEVEVYSRIPVYEDEADNIVGILFMKDLMIEAYRKGFQNVKLTEIMQEAYFVPETKNVNELFNEMQAEKKHIAILIDEYGGFSGIVTLEDLIEEVMGNIADEFDADDSSIKKLAINKYLINGELSLNDLNDYFHIELESKHYDTLSGLLIEHMGYIPEDDEDIAPIIINGVSFKPKRVKDKKIEWVLTIFNKEESLN
jgi:Hemolysins and related proteins containing CBS domains